MNYILKFSAVVAREWVNKYKNIKKNSTLY